MFSIYEALMCVPLKTKSGALCMENATLHQLDTNERLVFVFGECHAHSMGRK
jgi:hypothetical protein